MRARWDEIVCPRKNLEQIIIYLGYLAIAVIG